MSRFTSVALLSYGVLALAGLLVVGADPKAPPEKEKPNPLAGCRLSGPFSHDNLTLFLIHGDDSIKGRKILTLDEALEQKKAVVHETKNVNQLSIENVSDSEEVFIQAGAIVKGGQQDRILASDLVIPPKSGKVALESFCCEQSRWQQRGSESPTQFGSSKEQAANKSIQLATRGAMSQREVWAQIQRAQTALAKNVGADVKAPQSESSYQLTLEHKKLIQAVECYVEKLSPCLKDKNDVIGFAFAVNGEINSVDVYGSHELFKKLWPQLVKASSVEAMAELKKDKKFEPIKAEAITAFLTAADKGKQTDKEVTKGVHLIKKETDKILYLESVDKLNKAAPASLRCNIIAK